MEALRRLWKKFRRPHARSYVSLPQTDVGDSDKAHPKVDIQAQNRLEAQQDRSPRTYHQHLKSRAAYHLSYSSPQAAYLSPPIY